MPDPGRDQDPTAALQRVLATLSYLLTRSRAHERQATQAGVTAARSDLWLLMALEDSGGACRVGDLAELLMVEPPHVTRQIGQLEAQDLVERTQDSLDRRARKVAITRTARPSSSACSRPVRPVCVTPLPTSTTRTSPPPSRSLTTWSATPGTSTPSTPTRNASGAVGLEAVP
ncbi:MarR family winged helix-turn-helix transcriptional regulator [Streptomyces endophytica]|uniref:MarR family winged helix-turn-helix transcriptional regulator n=1 Tax=Streptomyces endophytica TaxID=2991496 RepID=A0ABY6P933_9ACTN|nr:MarR family winged helix-turn-helix transcriptional regulator [Streptomyces endophytica]UZJ30319.1 MarR family winged helix-turn-helix transcriptional regulator [Streptomyces endophytica]